MVTSTNANASGTANKIKSIIILPPNLSIIQTELIKLGLVKSIGSIIEFLIYIFMILQIILLLIEELEKNEKFKLKLNMGMAIQMIIIIILIWIIIMVINCIGRLINEKFK